MVLVLGMPKVCKGICLFGDEKKKLLFVLVIFFYYYASYKINHVGCIINIKKNARFITMRRTPKYFTNVI